MRRFHRALSIIAALLLVAVSTMPAVAEETEKEKKKGLRVEDLPKPIPQALDQLQRIGNDVGNELSKAASKTTEAVNKVIKGDKEKEQNKEKGK
jgi:ABC-type Na+ efflux pump permease subunit